MRRVVEKAASVNELPFERTGAFPRKVYISIGKVTMWVLVANKAEEKKAKKLHEWIVGRVEDCRRRMPSTISTEQIILAALIEVAHELKNFQHQYQQQLTTLLERVERLT